MPSRFAEAVFPEMFGMNLPGVLTRALDRLLAFDQLSQIYESVRDRADIVSGLIAQLGVKICLSDEDLARVPESGPVILTCNHPHGMLDGLVLSSALRAVRSDVKILANELLSSVPEMGELLIPVGRQTRNRRAVAAALAHLASGGLLIIFPAGEVSHFQWRKYAVADSRWDSGASRIAALAGNVTVVPAYIRGSNSALVSGCGYDSSAGTNRVARPGALEQVRPHYRSTDRRSNQERKTP